MKSLSSDDNPSNSLTNFRTPKSWKVRNCNSEIEYWKEREIQNKQENANISVLEMKLQDIERQLNREVQEPKDDDELMILIQEKNQLEYKRNAVIHEIKHIQENIPAMMISFYNDILKKLDSEL